LPSLFPIFLVRGTQINFLYFGITGTQIKKQFWIQSWKDHNNLYKVKRLQPSENKKKKTGILENHTEVISNIQKKIKKNTKSKQTIP